ncbi:MAG: RnfABCDGE type electron transport complex subunit D [Clostridia bacterium]|nr:RnfABCDGE type electron transport complex subunit D [Clostridia bacterium]
MDNAMLLVSNSPHVRSKTTTTRIMLDVIIALCPALIASAIVFGWRALLVVAFCVVMCVACEFVFEKFVKRENTVGDLSAVVTGILLAFNLPSTIPLWQAAVGCIVAIVIVKQLFGGIGCNFANPAITARIVMSMSFATSMSSFAMKNDATSSATPLSGGEMPSIMDLLIGNHNGSIGETCAIAIIAGGIYLIVRKVITWHTPVVFVGTVFVLSWLLGKDPVEQILMGGLLLAAVFMVTDYTTTPQTKWGKVIFGAGCGIITVLIRFYGNYPEGVSFAILFMNVLTPLISSCTKRRPFGGVKKK